MALLLRCCREDMTSFRGFRWPRPGEDLGHGPGIAVAPQWDPKPVCGGGLHGWLRGEGIAEAADRLCLEGVWLAVEVEEKNLVFLGGKVKFPWGRVVFAGGRREAVSYLEERGEAGPRCMFREKTGGDHVILTGGQSSILTGGYGAVIVGGTKSVLTGGGRSTITGDHHSKIKGGDDSTLVGGSCSELKGGDRATIVGGARSWLEGGDYSTLSAAPRSTLVGGNFSLLRGDETCFYSGGLGSVFMHESGGVVAKVGERGIEPGVFYQGDSWQRV